VILERGLSYVFKESGEGVVKQMIETGPASSTEVVVTRGLTEADRILLDRPPNERVARTIQLAGVTPGSSRH
jgi:hypothetical protein